MCNVVNIEYMCPTRMRKVTSLKHVSQILFGKKTAVHVLKFHSSRVGAVIRHSHSIFGSLQPAQRGCGLTIQIRLKKAQ